MAILWNTSRQYPVEFTKLTGWGKLGTGPYSVSYGNSMAAYNFYTQLIKFSNGSDDLNAHFSNAAIGGNFGIAIGERNSNQTSFTHTLMRINNNDLSKQVFPPWWTTLAGGHSYDNQFLLPTVDKNIICAGYNHVLVQYGNTLTGFGDNQYGQCNVPSTGVTGVCAVAGGFAHSLALYTNGSITAWGLSAQGQLNIPVGLTAQKISSGLYHNAVLKNDGTVVCWGGNSYSQCDVPVGLTGITYINCGYYHTMAIRNNGSVVCWGLNANGQCNVPAGVGTGGYQIAGGSAHTALLKIDGSVICWGDNTYKQATVPTAPDLDSGTYVVQDSPQIRPSNLGLTGSAIKVFCGENSTWVTNTLRSNSGLLYWKNLSQFGQSGYLGPVLTQAIDGPTSSNAIAGTSMYVKVQGYNPVRHDIYTYPSTPIYPNSVMPNGINTAWWLSGSTTERKLNKCFVSTYQEDGIFKAYDFFSPVDFSGCSIRPRRFGAPWIGGSSLETDVAGLGYVRLNETENLWNYFNSGFWTNILITKKHAIASKHYSGPNVNLYNVQWIRRDGQIITKKLTRVSNLNFSPYNPDMVLYELDTELSEDDLKNISIYNVLPKFTGMTGSKLIDTSAWVWKGITTPIDYTDGFFMSQVGRRVYYLDGQDRVYSKRISRIYTNSTPTSFLDYVLYTLSPCGSKYEPDDVAAEMYVGDSGTPIFITAANRSTKTENLEASYFVGQGTTWGRTLFCGLADAGAGQWGATFINNLNNFLITRGLTGNELLTQIEVDSGTVSLPWTAPVGAPVEYTQVKSISYTNGFSVSNIDEVIGNQNNLLGQATVAAWDSENKILSLSGISGSFNVSGITAYLIQNNNNPTVSYSQINPYVIPINNGLGTTAGSNNILDIESAGYTFDPNNPFGDE